MHLFTSLSHYYYLHYFPLDKKLKAPHVCNFSLVARLGWARNIIWAKIELENVGVMIRLEIDVLLSRDV